MAIKLTFPLINRIRNVRRILPHLISIQFRFKLSSVWICKVRVTGPTHPPDRGRKRGKGPLMKKEILTLFSFALKALQRT